MNILPATLFALATYVGASVWFGVPTSGGYVLPALPFLLALAFQARLTHFVPIALMAGVLNALWIEHSDSFVRQRELALLARERIEAVSALLPDGGTLVSVDLSLQPVTGRFSRGHEVEEMRLALFLLESRANGLPPEALVGLVAEQIALLDEAALQGRLAFDHPIITDSPSAEPLTQYLEVLKAALQSRYHEGPSERYGRSQVTRLMLE